MDLCDCKNIDSEYKQMLKRLLISDEFFGYMENATEYLNEYLNLHNTEFIAQLYVTQCMAKLYSEYVICEYPYEFDIKNDFDIPQNSKAQKMVEIINDFNSKLKYAIDEWDLKIYTNARIYQQFELILKYALKLKYESKKIKHEILSLINLLFVTIPNIDMKESDSSYLASIFLTQVLEYIFPIYITVLEEEYSVLKDVNTYRDIKKIKFHQHNIEHTIDLYEDYKESYNFCYTQISVNQNNIKYVLEYSNESSMKFHPIEKSNRNHVLHYLFHSKNGHEIVDDEIEDIKNNYMNKERFIDSDTILYSINESKFYQIYKYAITDTVTIHELKEME